MDEKKYIVIYNSDGDTCVNFYTVEEIMDEINDPDEPNPRFLSMAEVEAEIDTNYWPEGSSLIIKGKVEVPRPVEVIEKYTVG